MREGTTDISLQVLVERHAQARGFELSFDKDLSKPFNGPLSDVAVKIRTRKNFSQGAMDLAFYFADKDRGEFNKFEHIRDAIKSVDNAYLLKSVIGIPDPHMEAWLLADEDIVKQIFGLPGDEPLPFPELEPQPKSRLQALTSQCGDTELTPPLARSRLAESCNLTTLEQKSASYRQFIRRFNTFLNGLSN